MAKNQVSMPASTAGITRYFEDSRSRFEIKPGHVIVLCVLVMFIVILLNAYLGPAFGLGA